MAARLLHKIEQEFHVGMSMRELFETPTVSSLARRIDNIDNGFEKTDKALNLTHEVAIHDYKDNVLVYKFAFKGNSLSSVIFDVAAVAFQRPMC